MLYVQACDIMMQCHDAQREKKGKFVTRYYDTFHFPSISSWSPCTLWLKNKPRRRGDPQNEILKIQGHAIHNNCKRGDAERSLHGQTSSPLRTRETKRSFIGIGRTELCLRRNRNWLSEPVGMKLRKQNLNDKTGEKCQI